MNEKLKRIDYSKTFLKQLKKVDLKIKIAFRDRLSLFLKDPVHPQLRNHSLKGNYKGYRSINITGDWRVIFSEHIDQEGNKLIIFELLGTHSQLYQ